MMIPVRDKQTMSGNCVTEMKRRTKRVTNDKMTDEMEEGEKPTDNGRYRGWTKKDKTGKNRKRPEC